MKISVCVVPITKCPLLRSFLFGLSFAERGFAIATMLVEALSVLSDAWAVTPVPWSVRTMHYVTDTTHYVTGTTYYVTGITFDKTVT